MPKINRSDLILNSDGSIFHLHLKPDEIADTIILVGDPGRVRQVSSNFDLIELTRENREFVTHTGLYRGKRFSVVSTGIGTDNIDIVLNELDALVNIDLAGSVIKDTHNRLRLIRIGTCGLLDPEIEPGSYILTAISGGLDGVFHFYNISESLIMPDITEKFIQYFNWKDKLASPYFIKAPGRLAEFFEDDLIIKGITLSTPGFYGPQFRKLRLAPFTGSFFEKVTGFKFNGYNILNFEMESSALYGLSGALGHESVTVCAGIANRFTQQYIADYKPYITKLIGNILDKLVQTDDN